MIAVERHAGIAEDEVALAQEPIVAGQREPDIGVGGVGGLGDRPGRDAPDRVDDVRGCTEFEDAPQEDGRELVLTHAGHECPFDVVHRGLVYALRLAQAFGVDAVRAGSPGELTGALASALAAHRPALIEVPVGEFPSPWHLVRNYAPGKIPPPPNPLGEPRK